MRPGERVSLRLRTPLGPTDLVGTLVEVTDTTLLVRRRDGNVVEVQVASVVTGRVVPPGPAASIPVADLERVASRGWRPLEMAALGAWELRASAGFSRRGNSALAVGDPGRDLGSAVEAVAGWYAERGLPGRVQLVGREAPAGLREVLDERGWPSEGATHVMTAELGGLLRDQASPVGSDQREVEVAGEPGESWLASYRRYQWHRAAAGLPGAAVALLRGHPAVGFAAIRDPSGVVAIARVAVDGRWAGLSAVAVAEGSRRQGLGRSVSLAALRWAVGRGARRAYLQVEAPNEPAQRLYTQLGFSLHHDYEYRTEPD